MNATVFNLANNIVYSNNQKQNKVGTQEMYLERMSKQMWCHHRVDPVSCSHPAHAMLSPIPYPVP